jgi:hypothetical protein
MAKQRHTTEQQATDMSREGVQKKWKVGRNEKENGKVKNKFNRTTTSRSEGSLFTLHTFYNFIISFPLNPFHQQQCCVRVKESNFKIYNFTSYRCFR